MFEFFLGLWLIATILYQNPTGRLGRFDFMGFVPFCRFFAPNPVSVDTRLYYRLLQSPESQQDDSCPWLSVPIDGKSYISFIWAPQMRLEKTLHILSRQLLRVQRRHEELVYSIHYLRALNQCIALVGADRSPYIQFCILQQPGFGCGRYSRAFLSDVHRINF